MRYEPIKRSLGRVFSGNLFMRKLFYFFLDLLLLRAWYIKKELRKIRKELPDRAVILDAGSGFGQYVWRMSGMNKNWIINGVDISEEHVQDCTQFFGKAGMAERITFMIADLTTLADHNRYNLILSVDVMEHIREDEVVFRNFYASMKDNGILLISTPSDKGGSGADSDEDESFIGEHVRNGYSIKEITDKLASAGFRNIETSYTYGKPGNISWHLTMKYPIQMLNRSSLFVLLLPFYYLVIFPVSMILNIFDLRLMHKTGTGLMVKTRK